MMLCGYQSSVLNLVIVKKREQCFPGISNIYGAEEMVQDLTALSGFPMDFCLIPSTHTATRNCL